MEDNIHGDNSNQSGTHSNEDFLQKYFYKLVNTL